MMSGEGLCSFKDEEEDEVEGGRGDGALGDGIMRVRRRVGMGLKVGTGGRRDRPASGNEKGWGEGDGGAGGDEEEGGSRGVPGVKSPRNTGEESWTGLSVKGKKGEGSWAIVQAEPGVTAARPCCVWTRAGVGTAADSLSSKTAREKLSMLALLA